MSGTATKMVNVLPWAIVDSIQLFGPQTYAVGSSDWPSRRVCLVYFILLYAAYKVCTPNSDARLCSMPISRQLPGYATEP